MSNIPQPIIIMGMHRSGTSIISSILENIGLFIGNEKQGDFEAIFFLNINDGLLKKANLSWDNLEEVPIKWEKHNKEVLVKEIKEKINSKHFKHFLKKQKSIEQIDALWGWKDPRNTLTFDIWNEIFPQAKVLHIYRNPIDVANSLRKRYLESLDTKKYLIKTLKKVPNVLAEVRKERRITNNYNPSFFVDIEYGVSLWEMYVSEALRVKSILPSERYMEVKYELFLDAPEKELNKVIDFIGLNCSKEKLNNSLAVLNKSRKYAFLNSQYLIKQYQKIKQRKLLETLGYEAII